MYEIVPMTTGYANQVLTWQYEGEWAVYNFIQNDLAAYELISGGYFACLEQGECVGFFCFGEHGQIPTQEPSPYSEERLDIGLGMRPDLCGKGHGRIFLQAGIDFAIKYFCKPLRLTVACWNTRAIRVYEQAGFHTIGKVTHRYTGVVFYIMEHQ